MPSDKISSWTKNKENKIACKTLNIANIFIENHTEDTFHLNLDPVIEWQVLEAHLWLTSKACQIVYLLKIKDDFITL